MKICIFRPLDPLFPWISLNAVLWPIPSVLTFYYVQLSVNSKGSNRMAWMWSSSKLNDLIQPIESLNSEEISWMNQTLINFNLLYWSLYHLDFHILFKQLNISFNHPRRYMRSKEWNIRIRSNTTEEKLDCFYQRSEDSPIVRAELEKSNSFVQNIILIILLEILKFNSKLLLPEYLFKMIDVSSPNKEYILAKPWSLIMRSDNDWKWIKVIILRRISNLKINGLKTERLNSHLPAFSRKRTKIRLSKIEIIRSCNLWLALHFPRLQKLIVFIFLHLLLSLLQVTVALGIWIEDILSR